MYPRAADSKYLLAQVTQLVQVISYLDELLEIDNFQDYGPNGLQVPGANDLSVVATGVSAHLELFEQASSAGAQLVVAHHGLFWDFHPRSISPTMKRRLGVLFDNDISLAGYHLPLDAHPEHGNNALLATRLGASSHARAFAYQGQQIGVVARFDGDDGDGIPAADLFARVEAVTDREPLVFDAGPARIRTLGIVSGSAANTLAEAIDLQLDAFLTGEPKEHVMAQARENGIHFVAAGHYATETLGIRRLGELVAERFGVRHVFVDIPNPV
jgi:dinuclear metal center YbgI/SA1388 family protein